MYQRLLERYSFMPVDLKHRFPNSFGHIFAGGYAAGYYSYKWAEVLAADAFSLFQAQGLYNREVGKLFLDTFLGQGGACDPMAAFVAFRGRKPSPQALLALHGIAEAS